MSPVRNIFRRPIPAPEFAGAKKRYRVWFCQTRNFRGAHYTSLNNNAGRKTVTEFSPIQKHDHLNQLLFKAKIESSDEIAYDSESHPPGILSLYTIVMLVRGVRGSPTACRRRKKGARYETENCAGSPVSAFPFWSLGARVSAHALFAELLTVNPGVMVLFYLLIRPLVSSFPSLMCNVLHLSPPRILS